MKKVRIAFFKQTHREPIHQTGAGDVSDHAELPPMSLFHASMTDVRIHGMNLGVTQG